MNSSSQTQAPPAKVARSTVRLGLVCPMANEGDDAVAFTRQALDACQGFASVTFFAVFDKANKDNSLDLMREFSRSEPRLTVVWAPENRCVVDAYLRGYKEALAAGCDWILEIDAGFSHRPADIPRFFDAMDNGLDCVFGSRFMPGAGIHSSLKRRFVSRGGTMLTNLLLGTRQTDMTSGFELFSRKTLEMVLARGIRSRAHFFQTEIKVHCRDLRFVEVPIVYEMASPRLGRKAVKEAFIELWRLFRSRSAK
jgi:dolichol-phosphate mannosyltransferase